MGKIIVYMLLLFSLFAILQNSLSNGDLDPPAELSAITAVHVPSQCINDTAAQNRYTSLICWLWDLELSIPDDTFRKGLVSVTIKNMTCTNFQINSTSSEYIPGSLNILDYNPKLNLSIYGFSTVCTGKYESGFASGTLSVLVENFPSEPLYFQTSINSTLIQHGETDVIKVPSGWNVDECKTNLEVPKDGGINFSGSFSAKLIGLFSKPISKHVTSTINSQMCPQVKVTIENTLTDLIGKAVKFLEKLIFDEVDDNGSDRHSRMNEIYHLKHRQSDLSIPEALQSGERNIRGSSSYESLDQYSGLTTDDSNGIAGFIHVVSRNDLHSYSNNPRLDDTRVWNINDDGVLKWSEMASLEKSISEMSYFVNNHLDEGVFLKFLRRIGWFHNNSVSDDFTDCGYFFRGMNGLLKSITQDGQITFQVNQVINFTIASLGEVSIGIQNATISGIDSFSRIEFMPKVPNHINPAIALNKLGISINIEMKVIPKTGGIIHGSILDETFNLSIAAKRLALELMVEIIMLKDSFLNVTMHDLFVKNYTDIWSSLTRVLLAQPKSTISIDGLKIDPSQYSDSLEVSLDALLNNVITLILKEYDTLVSRTLQASFDGPILNSINKAIDHWIRKWKRDLSLKVDTSASNTTMLKTTDDFYRFNQSESVRKVHEFFSSEKLIKQMNDFIVCVSTFVKDNPLHPQSITHAGINVQFQDFTFGGIIMDDVDIMKSVDDYHIEFGVSANRPGYYGKELAVNLTAGFDYPEEELSFVTNLKILSSGIRAKTGAKVLYNTTALEATELYEILRYPSTLLTPLVFPFGFYGVGGVFDHISVALGMELSENGQHRSVSYSSGNPDKIGGLVTSCISVIGLTAQNILNGLSKVYLSGGKESSSAYTHLQGTVTTNSNEGAKFSGKSTCFLLLTIFVFLFNCAFFISRKNNHTGLSILHREHSSAIKSVSKHSALIFNRKVPNLVRSLIPIAIIVTIVLFIVSNLSIGASVDIQVRGTDGSLWLKIPTVTTFSLGKTVGEMYHARVYTLMTLVLVFSGIWPYVKLLMMFLSWCCPVHLLSFERREQLLIWLDALGKYSLVDSFVLVLMLVSFKFHIDLPGVGILDSFVIPAFGFYLFMIGTVLSLVIGHGVTFLHRLSKLPYIESSVSYEAICNHCYHMESRTDTSQSARLSRKAHYCWIFVILTCFALLAFGAIIESFTFDFEGLTGVLLGTGYKSKYSLWTLGSSLRRSVEDPNDLGIYCIQITFYFFALFMPFACLITVVALFYIPMKLKHQQIMFMLAEIANAWSAVDVFLLAILASMLELSQFAAFMVGDLCDFLKEPFFQDLFHGENTCFSVKSSVSWGASYLIVGVVLHTFIVFVILRLAHDALEERMLRERGLRSCGESAIISKINRSSVLSFLLERRTR